MKFSSCRPVDPPNKVFFLIACDAYCPCHDIDNKNNCQIIYYNSNVCANMNDIHSLLLKWVGQGFS